MVDVEGQLRIEVPERVVRQGGQVDDRIKALQVSPLDIPQVDALPGSSAGQSPNTQPSNRSLSSPATACPALRNIVAMTEPM